MPQYDRDTPAYARSMDNASSEFSSHPTSRPTFGQNDSHISTNASPVEQKRENDVQMPSLNVSLSPIRSIDTSTPACLENSATITSSENHDGPSSESLPCPTLQSVDGVDPLNNEETEGVAQIVEDGTLESQCFPKIQETPFLIQNIIHAFGFSQ